MIETRRWHFRVRCELETGERVHVTGSCGALGWWNAQRLFPLESENIHPQDGPEQMIWSGFADLPVDEIEYRFVICKSIKSGGDFMNSVRRWETDLHPRIIPAHGSNVENPKVFDFGLIGEYKKADEGWLVNDSALYLRLCRSNPAAENPVTLWKKKYKGKPCNIKVTPIDIRKSCGVDSILDFHGEESTEVELAELRSKSKADLPLVDVSVLREGLSEFHPQEQFGLQCMDEEYIVFRSRIADFSNIGFLVDLYCEMEHGELPTFIGNSILLPATFKDTYGSASVPITSPKHTPIGQLSVSYMVVHPLSNPPCTDTRLSYQRYWKDTWKGLEVGHRGAGNSFHAQPKNCANIRENTIASLKHAFENGADMVEFDVQLSKDLVPVIYHDFHAIIALKHKKEPLKTDLVEIPVKDLTVSQLQALKLYHKSEKGLDRFSDEELDDHQPFPTLERALQCVPVSCGFNIEIKWTMQLKDGTYELYHPFELNSFLDKILKVILENQSPRRIVFSCFHPDICTMIRMKQNLYPVLFLTMGEKHEFQHYEDLRTHTVERAILYASSANILGINAYSNDLLTNASHVERATSQGLVVFCWGDQNSDPDTITYLKDIGVHGIIYDKIDVYNTKKSKKRSVFVCDDKETCRCFPSSCRVGSENGNGPKIESPTSQKRSESSEESGPESPKRFCSEQAPKQPCDRLSNVSSLKTGDASSPSFCGVLSTEAKKLVPSN